MPRKRKPQCIGRVKFQRNGAEMACYLHPQAPPSGDASDVIEVRISTVIDGDAIDDSSFFMNLYDMQNLIFLLAGASAVIMERHIPMMPKDMVRDLELRIAANDLAQGRP